MRPVVMGSLSTDGDIKARFREFMNVISFSFGGSKVDCCYIRSLTFSGAATSAKLETNLWNTSYNPGQDQSMVMFVGSFRPRIAFIACDAISTRPRWMNCPRQSFFLAKNRFSALSVTSALQGSVTTAWTWRLCFCVDLEKTTMSPRCTRASCQFTVET